MVLCLCLLACGCSKAPPGRDGSPDGTVKEIPDGVDLCGDGSCGCLGGGDCDAGQSCYQGRCCTATTCASQGKNCGTVSDGCGHTLDCGSCSPPERCGGGGVEQVCGVDAKAQGPFDVVVFMLDDLDVGSFERLLTLGKLPNIQRHLLDSGAKFTEAFVPNSSCCPSRASFFTGQYCHNHSVKSVGGSEGGYLAMSTSGAEGRTIALALQQAGYRTGFFGKYMNGYDMGMDPYGSTWNGTDEVRVACPAGQCVVPPGWDDWVAMQFGAVGTYSTFPYVGCDSVRRNYVLISSSAEGKYALGSPLYQTDRLDQSAQAFINQNAKAPFFLYLAPTIPHTEVFIDDSHHEICTGTSGKAAYIAAHHVRPAPRHAGSLAGKVTMPRDLRFNAIGTDRPYWFSDEGWWGKPLSDLDAKNLEHFYLDRMEAMLAVDEMVGGVVNALDKAGVLDRTVLVLVSDNGYQFGEFRTVNKMFPYEESIRVPLVIRTPGAGAGRTIEASVLMNDLAPTIWDYTGQASSSILKMDGRSLRSLLEGAKPSWRNQVLVEHWYARGATALGFPELPDYYAVRTRKGAEFAAHQTYAEYYDDLKPDTSFWASGVEHFLMNSDPGQMVNLAFASSTDRHRMHLSRVLNLLRFCQGDSCQRAEDVPLPSTTTCQPISGARVRVLYDANGDVTGLRQHLVSGGVTWTRDGDPQGNWSTGWSVAGLAQLWGAIGSSPAPGAAPASHPSVEGVDAMVVRDLFDSAGQHVGLRQVYFKGERSWWRDSRDNAGSEWPAVWSTVTWKQPWTSGPYAAEMVPVYDPATGQMVRLRQIFVDSEGSRTYWQDSDDQAGTQWPTAWHSEASPVARVDSIAVHPIFNSTGVRTAMRQLFFAGGKLWSRTSRDAEGAVWPDWTVQSLAEHWGSQPQHPPITTECD